MKLHMEMIKLEINIAEIKSAIEEVKLNRLKVFDRFTNEVKSAASRILNFGLILAIGSQLILKSQILVISYAHPPLPDHNNLKSQVYERIL